MIELNYNINGENTVHKFPRYYDCDKNWFQIAELETKEYFKNTIKENFNIIDAGAQIGMYTVLFSKLAPKGNIYAFEPTDTSDFLEENLKENNVKNVKIERTALSNKLGKFVDKIFKVWSQQIIEEKDFNFETIDNYVNKNKLKIDLIKIDVDSYDYEVLQGCENFFKEQSPIVVAELNHALEKRNYTVEQAVNLMLSYGYKIYAVLDGENYVFIKD